jgi:hypothetical protein
VFRGLLVAVGEGERGVGFIGDLRCGLLDHNIALSIERNKGFNFGAHFGEEEGE